MKFRFHKKFKKQYKKLSPNLKKKTKTTLQKFEKNPLNLQLRNHPLKGKLTGKRAISITGDVRIIFVEQKNYTLVIMLYIGIHNHVYK